MVVNRQAVFKRADGRYNIVLQGVERFRIAAEDASGAFRVAQVEALPETSPDPGEAETRQRRLRLDALLARSVERAGGTPRLPENPADHALVNALAQYLDFEPVERQALLECDGVCARADSLINLLEMRLRAQPTLPSERGAVH